MSDMSVEIEGLAELQTALKKFPNEFKKAAEQVLGQPLALLTREAKQTVRRDTSRLGDSIASEIVRTPGSQIVGKVGTNVEYAIHQEYGPRPGSGYDWTFRPYLRPALKKHKAKVQQMVDKAIAKILKRLFK